MSTSGRAHEVGEGKALGEACNVMLKEKLIQRDSQ